MKNILLVVPIPFLGLMACNRNEASIKVAESQLTIKRDHDEIKRLIAKYAESINNADSAVGSDLFAHTNEVSFIHPRGREVGWTQIHNSIYTFFDTTFSKRDLKTFNENVTVYENSAWAEFNWVFDATFKSDNTPLQTKGRETQIWRKLNGKWQIVHVHYSTMPVEF